MLIRHFLLPFLALQLAVVPLAGADPQKAGTIVAVRGKVTIRKPTGSLPAKVKMEIGTTDSVSTAAGSKVKMLFVDDSVLTLDADSKLDISEFVHEKGKTGRSVFNLLEGKMRSVVGRTRFEVRTPTAVAAARGTIIFFEVTTIGDRKFTTITCLEGTVEIHSTGNDQQKVTVTPGMRVTVPMGEPPSQPKPVPPAELEKQKKESVKVGGEVLVLKQDPAGQTSSGGGSTSGTGGNTSGTGGGTGGTDGTGTSGGSSGQAEMSKQQLQDAFAGTDLTVVGPTADNPVQPDPATYIPPTKVNIDIRF